MKIFVITGASDGIGAEMARQLASAQTGLVLAGRSQDKLNAVQAECEAKGAQVITAAMDVAVEAQCRALVDAAIAKFGRIDQRAALRFNRDVHGGRDHLRALGLAIRLHGIELFLAAAGQDQALSLIHI